MTEDNQLQTHSPNLTHISQPRHMRCFNLSLGLYRMIRTGSQCEAARVVRGYMTTILQHRAPENRIKVTLSSGLCSVRAGCAIDKSEPMRLPPRQQPIRGTTKQSKRRIHKITSSIQHQHRWVYCLQPLSHSSSLPSVSTPRCPRSSAALLHPAGSLPGCWHWQSHCAAPLPSPPPPPSAGTAVPAAGP